MSNNTAFPPSDGKVFTIAKIIKSVMSSASQDELGTLFMNCKETIPVHKALEEMGKNQPLTPMQTDNTTEHGVVANNIASKRLKSMDMRLHWLLCIAMQGQL